ncbi:hypothetical protein BC567DRAFT_38380 [Phyllosticta citribraziliensis]
MRQMGRQTAIQAETRHTKAKTRARLSILAHCLLSCLLAYSRILLLARLNSISISPPLHSNPTSTRLGNPTKSEPRAPYLRPHPHYAHTFIQDQCAASWRTKPTDRPTNRPFETPIRTTPKMQKTEGHKEAHYWKGDTEKREKYSRDTNTSACALLHRRSRATGDRAI